MTLSDATVRAQAATLKNRIDQFLASPAYIIAVMALAAISGIFGAEAFVYTLYTAVVVYACFWGEDLLCLSPLFICCYIAPSRANNPGRNEASVFAPGHGGIYMACLAALIVISLIYRVIRDRKRFCRKYTLLPGMLLLMAAYLLSGIGSNGYTAIAGKNLLFALAQSASVLIPYLLFCGGINWEKARKDYFPWIGFCVGSVLLLQLLWVYLTGDVVQGGVIERTQIYTGWGMYNNVGGLMTMTIPFAFYLATRYRKGWIGIIVGSVYMAGILLTCSRSSILSSCAIYIVSMVLTLHYNGNRKDNTIAVIAVVGALSAVVLVFNRQFLVLFSDLLSKGLDPYGRDMIYARGLDQFKAFPVFGATFYPSDFRPWEWSTNPAFTGFFPPRWHNTIIQLMACCGGVGLLAYLFHRVQTLRLFLKQRSKEKNFIACSLLVLLLCSLFDCHFFNIGPVLLYSTALAFAENDIKTP